MIKLVCESGVTVLTFNHIPFEDNPNTAKSLAFDIEYNNSTTKTIIREIWFYAEDLNDFKEKLGSSDFQDYKKKLKNNDYDGVSLEAMSEFKLSLSQADELGHYYVDIKMESFTSETVVTSRFLSFIPDLFKFSDELATEK